MIYVKFHSIASQEALNTPLIHLNQVTVSWDCCKSSCPLDCIFLNSSSSNLICELLRGKFPELSLRPNRGKAGGNRRWRHNTPPSGQWWPASLTTQKAAGPHQWSNEKQIIDAMLSSFTGYGAVGTLASTSWSFSAEMTGHSQTLKKRSFMHFLSSFLCLLPTQYIIIWAQVPLRLMTLHITQVMLLFPFLLL